MLTSLVHSVLSLHETVRTIEVRLEKIIDALKIKPDASFPHLFNTQAQYEGLHRFLNNSRFDYRELLEPHIEATAGRSQCVGQVAVIHDSTEFAWPLHNTRRRHLVSLSARRQGFLAHNSLVIALEPGVHCPLGLSSMIPYVHLSDLPEDESDTELFWDNLGGLFDNESQRWLNGFQRSYERLGACQRQVHICDSEGDNYELLSLMNSSDGADFVVRLGQHQRLVLTAEDKEPVQLCDVRSKALLMGMREVALEPRPARTKGHTRSHYREGRQAKLEVRAMPLSLVKPSSWSSTRGPAKLGMWVVWATEVEPPAGEEPVEWVLATSEPVSNEAQANYILDLYELRWLIEEFHKSLKTGCGLKERQLESCEALLKVIAATAPLAQDLLLLRHMAREQPQAPWQTVVTANQLAVLQATVEDISWSEQPTVGQVFEAIAHIGGHIRPAKPPGWLILGRGFKEMLILEQGFNAALNVLQRDV